jgi:hypothetical protein
MPKAANITGASPWIMLWYSIISPRAGHPLGRILGSDRRRDLQGLEHQLSQACADEGGNFGDAGRQGIHIKYVPARLSFANKTTT